MKIHSDKSMFFHLMWIFFYLLKTYNLCTADVNNKNKFKHFSFIDILSLYYFFLSSKPIFYYLLSKQQLLLFIFDIAPI